MLPVAVYLLAGLAILFLALASSRRLYRASICSGQTLYEVPVPTHFADLQKVHPRMRTYRMTPALRALLEARLLGMQWRGLPVRFLDFVHWARDHGQRLYLYGGAVRDFLMMDPIKDIDLFAGDDRITLESLSRFCDHRPQLSCIRHPRWNHVLKIRSSQEERPDDGTFSTMDLSTEQSLWNPDEHYDFTVNWIVLELTDELLLDLTGSGVADVCSQVLRIAAPHDRWSAWYDQPLCYRQVLRYFKFLGKGLHSADAATERFITDRLVEDWNEVKKVAYIFFDTKHPDLLFRLLLEYVERHHPDALPRIRKDVLYLLQNPPVPLFAPGASA